MNFVSFTASRILKNINHKICHLKKNKVFQLNSYLVVTRGFPVDPVYCLLFFSLVVVYFMSRRDKLSFDWHSLKPQLEVNEITEHVAKHHSKKKRLRTLTDHNGMYKLVQSLTLLSLKSAKNAEGKLSFFTSYQHFCHYFGTNTSGYKLPQWQSLPQNIAFTRWTERIVGNYYTTLHYTGIFSYPPQVKAPFVKR